MNSNFTITFLENGEEQTKQIPLIDICWFQYVSTGGQGDVEAQGEVEVEGQAQPQQPQQQELGILKFRDECPNYSFESAIYCLGGKLPLRYVRNMDLTEKRMVNFERGIDITGLNLHIPIQLDNPSLYDSYLYLINFIQFTGSFDSWIPSNGFYKERWTMEYNTEEEMDALLDNYRNRVEEEGCIGCGEYIHSGVGDYCAECWTQVHM